MKSNIWKTAAATSAYFGVHSLLASRGAKKLAAERFGTQNSNGWYRVFYAIQAVVGLLALGVYLQKLPNQTLYQTRGIAAWLLRLAQLCGLIWVVCSVYPVGVRRLLGLSNLLAHLAGEEIGPASEAQGPIQNDDGSLNIEGAFRLSRQPLNFGPLVILWLSPKMTANLAAFNAVMTAYMIWGSKQQEKRLRDAYGEEYEAYQNSGVPLLVPRWPERNS